MSKKNNRAEELDQLLAKAAAIASSDNSLAEARQYIVAAMNSVQKISKKRNKRVSEELTASQQWQLDLKTGTLVRNISSIEAKNILTNIEQMIAQEEANLDQIANPETKTELLSD